MSPLGTDLGGDYYEGIAGADPELDLGGLNPDPDFGGHNYLCHVKIFLTLLLAKETLPFGGP